MVIDMSSSQTEKIIEQMENLNKRLEQVVDILDEGLKLANKWLEDIIELEDVVNEK